MIVNVYDLFNIERATKDKVYPKGSILIQLSATRGQSEYLKEDSTVSTHYAVLINKSDFDSYYLYHIVEAELPKFLHQWQTGINLQISNLKFFELNVYDKEFQDDFLEKVKIIDMKIQEIEQRIEFDKGVKKWMLNKMFPKF